MVRMVAIVLALAVLASCSNPTSGGSSGSSGYNVSVKIINFPVGVIGHKVRIYVEQETSPSVFNVNAQVNALASSTFTETLKTRTSPSDPGTNAKTYSGQVTLTFDVEVDVDGDNLFTTSGTDKYDSTHYAKVVFTGAGTQTIDYATLNSLF